MSLRKHPLTKRKKQLKIAKGVKKDVQKPPRRILPAEKEVPIFCAVPLVIEHMTDETDVLVMSTRLTFL